MGAAVRMVATGPISAAGIGALARCVEVEIGEAPKISIRGMWEGDGISIEQGGAPRPARVQFRELVEVLSIGRRLLRICAAAPVTVVPERGVGVVIEITSKESSE